MEKPDDLNKSSFLEKLKRNNKQIRDDRATTIVENVERIYRRKIEDYEYDLTEINRKRNSLLDLSPNDTTSMNLKDFDPNQFIEDSRILGLKEREIEINLEILVKQYNELFK